MTLVMNPDVAKLDEAGANQEGVVQPLPTPVNLPIPPLIKPTSRARTYRIPNTSDAAAAAIYSLVVPPPLSILEL